ncbi:ribonuclease H-like domain-containing protein [Tanacetum coccineum]
MEDVLHSFVAESDQQIIYEDFDQIGKLDLEELDIKWQMAMLSVRVNRFEKKAGRKINFNNRDAARFDKKKVRCYKCSQLGHFARECTGKQIRLKWKESSKTLAKLSYSSMTVKTKLGLGYGDYIGEDEIYYPTMPSIFDTTPEDVDGNSNPVRFVKEGAMMFSPNLLLDISVPTSIHSDFDESQMTYGKNSNDQSETYSNDFVFCASSDKSSEPKTNDFALCDSSDKSSSPKSVESSVFSPRVVEPESNLKIALKNTFPFNNNTTFCFFC